MDGLNVYAKCAGKSVSNSFDAEICARIVIGSVFWLDFELVHQLEANPHFRFEHNIPVSVSPAPPVPATAPIAAPPQAPPSTIAAVRLTLAVLA